MPAIVSRRAFIQANGGQGSMTGEVLGVEAENLDYNIYGNTSGNISNAGYAAQEGDWIYYFNLGVDGPALYKIRTDGSGKMKLNSDVSTSINVVGDWIYYCKGRLYDEGIYTLNGPIYKIRTDGTEETIINDEDSISIK
jgi:hypothetical protein